ncbi:sugar ABC transporter permease [Cryobacterium sp. GrIS_2_6]|uniref:carbohydrate ABC transporter permease n=1 Tax=Cryobacterium sp. GrIS_2_6 TaxID=3162785 RepID=UPI002E024D5D|nr:ABC-type sugar transport system permease subunit [Cryobacterium psychrotolerans]
MTVHVDERRTTSKRMPLPRNTARRRRRARLQPVLLFMVPSALILGGFVFWPIVQSLYYSFFDWTIGADAQNWVGLGNYAELLSDDHFWNSLGVTLTFTAASVIIVMLLALAAAFALVKDSWFNRLVRSVFFFPTIVSLVSIGLVWKFLLDPSIGLVGGLFQAVGLPPVAWLQSTELALPTVIFVNIWKNVGYSMIILIAGLKGVPAERYEAGRLDGATDRQLTRYVSLPGIRPTLLFATLILTIQSFQVFDLVYVMTGGGPIFATDSIVNQLFREGFVNFRTGYASAISWVLFLLIIVISALQLRFFRYNDVD